MTDSFDDLVAALDTPLVIVTTASNGQRAGCVVGFHTQCSIAPPRFAVWLSKANLTYRVSLFATHLAVHVPSADDHDLIELFGGVSGDDVDKFARCDWTPGPADVPLLTRCPSRMVLERVTAWDDSSDHVCFVGIPLEAHVEPGLAPLHLSAVHIDAGHEADERDVPRSLRGAGADPAPSPAEARPH